MTLEKTLALLGRPLRYTLKGRLQLRHAGALVPIIGVAFRSLRHFFVFDCPL